MSILTVAFLAVLLIVLVGFYPGSTLVWLLAQFHVHFYRALPEGSLRKRWKKVYKKVSKARHAKNRHKSSHADHNTTGS